MLGRLGLLGALVFVLVCGAGEAFAQRPATIMLIDDGAEELARKVRAEGMHIGFAIIDRRESPAGTSDPKLLERSGAIALVRVTSEDQVEVLVVRPQNEGLYSETIRRRPGEGEAFPVRVVEQIRARLVELKVWAPEQAQSGAAAQDAQAKPARAEEPGPPHAASSGPPEADRARVAPGDTGAPAQIWVGGGAAGTLASGGVGPAAYGLLDGRFEPNPRWSIAVLAWLPVTSSDVSAPEGEAEISATLVAAELGYSPLLHDRWFVAGGVGGGILVLALSGEASNAYVARDDRLTAGVYYAHASAGRKLTDWLRLRAGLLAGMSAPRPVLRFDDREVASWGRAFGGVAINAEIGLPLASTEANP